MNLRAQGARLLGKLIRRTGRGGGTTLPGRALLAVEPDALGRLGSRLEGSVLVSATNGKTTTAAMLDLILRGAGRDVVANSAGSNMPWGIVTSLIERRRGLGLFEVDEAWLSRVAKELEPEAIVLGNLFRDQLDRYGETERLAGQWSDLAASSPPGTVFALNADDPIIAGIGSETATTPLFFGIDDPGVALGSEPHAADARRCRRCGEKLVFERTYLGHLGLYSCPACGFTRPSPDLVAFGIELIGAEAVRATVALDGKEVPLELPLPGLYNLYNALGALAGAIALGLDLGDAADSLGRMEPVFGRAERIDLAGAETTVLLIKNPVGANEVIRTLGSVTGPFDLWIALNDRIADGRDISWIWDADFEDLPDTVRRVTCSGTRAAEMALRLKYGGIDPDSIEIAPGVGPSLDQAARNSGGTLFALPTYTALLELQDHITRDANRDPYWKAGSA